ncbi:MAG: hypothetical protein Tsb002_12730 [Wenzhouxiangellaceae bacterium]
MAAVTPSSPVVPWRLNALLSLIFSALHLCTLWLLPLGWLPEYASPVLLVLMVLITTPLWALIHEAIHGHWHQRPLLNRLGGRWLGIIFGSPFRLLRYGHLHHHRHSRQNGDRTEAYDASRLPRWRAALMFYPRLLMGLYLGEIAVNFVLWLPRSWLLKILRKLQPDADASRQRAENELLSPAALRELRLDAALILLLYGSALWLYGADAWQLALVLAGRGLLISLVDNSFHYQTPLSDHLYAVNLRLPRAAAACVLNFNMHRTHHRQVNLPWTALPAATRYQDEDPTWLRGILRQLKGPQSLTTLESLELPSHWRRRPQPR